MQALFTGSLRTLKVLKISTIRMLYIREEKILTSLKTEELKEDSHNKKKRKKCQVTSSKLKPSKILRNKLNISMLRDNKLN